MRRITILATLTLTALSTYAFAENSTKCVPLEQINTAMDKMGKVNSQLLEAQTEHVATLKAKNNAFSAIQKCKSEKSDLGDVIDILTLQDPKCDSEIESFKMLELKSRNESQIISALAAMSNTYSTLIASSSQIACK